MRYRFGGVLTGMRRNVCLVLVTASAWLGGADQPLDFPHNTHVAAGLECIDCHTGVESRAQAGLPSVRKCMLCHATVATDKPGVKALRDWADRKREIPWTRVYGFEAEAQVKFNHAPHTWAKVECKTCHGEVERMGVAQRAVKHTMGTCITCHRQNNASVDCVACHF
ncbi:MAG: cytochrome c3 family protein [Bryobacteraceae bacterium]|nr:cytochrome c3 family protein [Bryobacteraceae bacterium]